MKRWDDTLWLLTPAELDRLDDGVMLECISGERVVKGANYIDKDTRFGVLAYGLTTELVETQKLEVLFQQFILES